MPNLKRAHQRAYRVGEAKSASTLRELQQMAKEAKFDIYRDQIYYEMADIAFSDGDREEGIEYMRQSLAANAGNARQAAKGYRRLADLYFETQDYVSASNYFDSTLQVLPSDDPSFATVTEYRNSIEPIAASLNAIALQDSLLAIAALSPEDQRSFAAELEASRREAELAAAIAANKKAASAPATRVATVGAAGRRPTGGAGGGEAISEFFAYDSRATRRGAREFVRTVGRPTTGRQLADLVGAGVAGRRRRGRLPARQSLGDERQRPRRHPRRRAEYPRGQSGRQCRHRGFVVRPRAGLPRPARQPHARE